MERKKKTISNLSNLHFKLGCFGKPYAPN